MEGERERESAEERGWEREGSTAWDVSRIPILLCVHRCLRFQAGHGVHIHRSMSTICIWIIGLISQQDSGHEVRGS